MKEDLARLFEAILPQVEAIVEAQVNLRMRGRLEAAAAALGVPGTQDPREEGGKRGSPHKHPHADHWRMELRGGPGLAGTAGNGKGKRSVEWMRAFLERYDAALGDIDARRTMLKAEGVTKSAIDYWRKLAKMPGPGNKKRQAKAPATTGSFTPERRAELLAMQKTSGLSMASFAKKMGIPQATFWGWSAGRGSKRSQKVRGPNKPSGKRRSPVKLTDNEKRAFVIKTLTLPPVERELHIKREGVSLTSYFRWLKWVKANPE